MTFVNLQVSLADLPDAAVLEMEPMAEAYEREVKTQQGIIWLPVLLLSFLPALLAQSIHLLLIPAFVLLLAVIIARLMIRKSSLKGIALRSHDIAYRSGLYWQRTVMLAFNRVQHVEVSSGPLQRKFGLASVKFFTAGGSGVDLKVDGLTRERAEQVRAYVVAKGGDTEAE